MSVKNYLNVFKEMVEKEKLYAKALTELSKKIEHPVLQSIFVGIASDSLKHSQLYEGLVKLLTSPQPVLSQKELELISREIEEKLISILRLRLRWLNSLVSCLKKLKTLG